MVMDPEEIPQIIADLQRVLSGQLSLRIEDYLRGGGQYQPRQIFRRMGSWGAALLLAGLVSEVPKFGNHLRKPAGPTTPRTCLRCDRDFPSEGSWNRICNICQETKAWKGEDGGDSHLLVLRGYPD